MEALLHRVISVMVINHFQSVKKRKQKRIILRSSTKIGSVVSKIRVDTQCTTDVIHRVDVFILNTFSASQKGAILMLFFVKLFFLTVYLQNIDISQLGLPLNDS